MIVLITGASHTGKTLLAQRMLEEYKIPYLSIDHLKMGLIRSGQTELTPEDDEALTGYLWPIVREMVKTAIENQQNLIVEGCYIPFDWRKDFDEQYLQSIRFVCLAMTDAYIDAHFAEIKEHGSDIEVRLDDSDCTIESLKEDNHAYIEGCQKYGERVVMIDSDYQLTINKLLDEELGFVKGTQKKVISFFESDCQEHWLEEIKRSDWKAGAFLYELLSTGRFCEAVGEDSKVLLLTDGDELISYCTYAKKDDIQPTEISPWMGFVYTFPKHRGHRYVGLLFEEIERLAMEEQVSQVYISTNRVGLYEKYGCEFLTTMNDMDGEPSRVYVKRMIQSKQ